MLNSLRSAAGTWVAKLLLVILVVSFAIWGITGHMFNGAAGGGSIVTVGSTKVSAIDFRLAYNRQLNQLSQQFGQQLTPEQAAAFGLEDQVLAQLASGAVLDEQARLMGLGVSEDRIADMTFKDPAFQGPGGGFDRKRFDYVLREVGMSQRAYFQSREQAAARQQIIEAMSDGVEPPDAFLRAVSLYRGEDRSADYLVLPKSLVEPIEEPAADKLAAWFEERKKTYAAPEYRKLAIVSLDAAAVADEATVDDAAVRKAYDDGKARYTTQETRTIDQIVFTDPAKADAALASIRGGATWDSVLTAENKTAADAALGTVTKDAIADKTIADAAFALPLGQVSDVVQGAFGPVLLRVTAITPQTVKTFEEVSADIRKELALAEANTALLSVRDSFEDARASGATLREAAGRLKLKVDTVDAIDRSGQRPDGTVVTDLPASQALIAGAFEAEQGTENEPIVNPAGGYVFYDVEGVTPARDRPLDEVREKVVADWKAEETKTRLGARAAELEKQVKDGTKTLDALATDLSLQKQTKLGLKRQANDADFGPDGVEAAFSVAEGNVGLFPTDDAQVLFKVTAVSEPVDAGPDAVAADARKQFGDGIANDMLDQVVTRLRGQYDVQVNREAASRAVQSASR